MDIIELGTNLIQEKFGLDIDPATISSALSALTGGEGGGFDIQGLVSQFMEGGGLGDIVQSWLGDGANSAISADQIMDIFGSGKVGEFASQLGLGEGQAAEGLADIIPQMIDQASSGGSLLDSLGGLDGVMGMAKKFF